MGNRFYSTVRTRVTAAVFAILLLQCDPACADGMKLEVIKLPALRVDGHAATAHTQGLEIAGRSYYVTGRREDVRPKRALLLRTEKGGSNWDLWDITPAAPVRAATALDHPGGMQSDGKRLWIPIAESRPKSYSIIRAFSLAGIAVNQPLKPDVEFHVKDHIGAVAVDAGRALVIGANWDTEVVYVWDLAGHLKRTLTGSALALRGLGVANQNSGVAVQDWKVIGDRLFASGLLKKAEPASLSSSRWISFTNFLESDFRRMAVALPLRDGTELAREAMAFSEGSIHFLPEELGASKRLFRLPMTTLLNRKGLQ